MSRSLRTYLFGLVTALCLTAICSLPSFADARLSDGSTAGCSNWTVTSSPNPQNGTVVQGIAVVSASDVWMVGQASTSGVSGYAAMAEHWDGQQWSIVPMPNTAPIESLSGAAAAATNDVWAVGVQATTLGQTLIEHWNGQAWSVVPSPNVANSTNYLKAVSVVSSDDVWTVGYERLGFRGARKTLIEHWDGTSWSIIPSPNAGTIGDELDGVTAISANDVWAVGNYGVGFVSNAPLVEHWDGTSWSIVSAPTLQGLSSNLVSISAFNRKNIWAVGYSFDDLTDNYATLMEHWDGTSWSIAQNPVIVHSVGELLGVTTIAPDDAWAVGLQQNYATSNPPVTTLTLHWDGQQWSVVTSPNISTNEDILRAVAHVPGSSQVWAVGGTYPSSGGEDSLAMHICP